MVAPVAHLVQPATASADGSFADAHFTETTVFSSLASPITVRFASDGRAFVAEKRGIIKAYDSVDDASATQVLDIRTVVHDFWDRGLMSIALDPDFLSGRPYIYVFYVYDAPPGQTAPFWDDDCPDPPGATTDGCTVRSKLDRYTVNVTSNVANPASRLNLIGDGANGEWCQQFPSHAGGALAFGPDGYLYVTGGDGASFNGMDWGQLGGHAGSPTPVNPCGDPFPGGVQSTAEGGMLRSQDVRTQGDPTSLDGTIARIDPDTGNAPADNPMKDFSGADSNTKRIVATGFRNPFRMTFRPGHSDLYVGDVGQNTWEEVDRFTMSGSTPTNIPNFGWPCYEGAVHQQAFENVGTDMCASLYDQGATGPLYRYTHIGSLTPKGPCFPGSADQTSSISGLAFYEGASGASIDYPSKYDGALFFVDYSRDCLGAILPQASGIPDPGQVEQVASGIANPVDIVRGPGGDLYYVDLNGGRVVRIKYANAPIARATANPDGGQAPISIHLNGASSSDPDPDFAIDGWDWDFFNDGSFDDSGQQVDWQIDTPGAYQVKLRVHSTSGLTDTVTLTIDAHNARARPHHQRTRLVRRSRPAVLVGRQPHRRQRHRDGPRGWGPGRRSVRLGADHPPLPGGLSHAHDPHQVEYEVVDVRRARSRVPVLARGSPHGHRQRRHLRLDLGCAAAPDLDAAPQLGPRRRVTVGRQQHRSGAMGCDLHPERVSEHQRPIDPHDRRPAVPVQHLE